MAGPRHPSSEQLVSLPRIPVQGTTVIELAELLFDRKYADSDRYSINGRKVFEPVACVFGVFLAMEPLQKIVRTGLSGIPITREFNVSFRAMWDLSIAWRSFEGQGVLSHLGTTYLLRCLGSGEYLCVASQRHHEPIETPWGTLDPRAYNKIWGLITQLDPPPLPSVLTPTPGCVGIHMPSQWSVILPESDFHSSFEGCYKQPSE